MGVPPIRIEIHTTISGVVFAECYGRRVESTIDGITVTIVSLEDLKANKHASNRAREACLF